jgi:hypothetical protein
MVQVAEIISIFGSAPGLLSGNTRPETLDNPKQFAVLVAGESEKDQRLDFPDISGPVAFNLF